MANNDGDIRPAVAAAIQSISPHTEGVQRTTFRLPWLQGIPLNEAEMVGIAEAISCSTHLEEVELIAGVRGSLAAATSTFLCKILETHPSIRKIDLQQNQINSSMAEVIGLAIKTNTSLKELFLYYNDIGDVGAEALAEGLRHNKALQKFNIGLNHIGDRGTTALAEALRTNKTLEMLYLGSNHLTMNGAKVLSSALEKASLKQLCLGYNDLQDEGGKALAGSLFKNKSLTRLELCDTGISDETCKALAAALSNNSSLTVLELNENDEGITIVGLKALENVLKHLNYTAETVHFSYSRTITQDHLEQIDRLCSQNMHLNAFFQQVNQNIPTIPLGVWPRVLEAVECKPDLLFALLKTKPEICRELQRNQRRRRHPDWLRN